MPTSNSRTEMDMPRSAAGQLERIRTHTWGPVITGAEVSIIAKASSDVTKGVRAALAQPPIKWPNAHEALMELYIILDDWCAAATLSNEAARSALDARLDDQEPPKTPPIEQMVTGSIFSTNPGMNISPGYAEQVTRDAERVLPPSGGPHPWRKVRC